MEVQRISTPDTYDLRLRVLRPGKPVESSYYEQDPMAVHFGVRAKGSLVSIVTAHPEPRFGEPFAWRIRGMATEPELQGQGLGRLVLEALLEWGRASEVPLFWCNARLGALRFYERMGFTIESEIFEIEGIGPHRVMRKVL